jgi:hypothetical protein
MVKFAEVGSGVDGNGVPGVFSDDGVEVGVLNSEGDQMVGMASSFVSSAGAGARPEQCASVFLWRAGPTTLVLLRRRKRVRAMLRR